jgi:hypothetical protein
MHHEDQSWWVDDDDHVDGVRLRLWTAVITQVIYVHGEPWWNYDVKKVNWLVHHNSLKQLSAESSGSKQKNGQKEWEFSLVKYLYLYLQMIFYLL